MISERLWDWALVIVLGIAGGIARLLERKDIKELSPFAIIGQIFVAAVIAVLFWLALNWTGLPDSVVVAIGGVAAFIGPASLTGLAKRLSKDSGVDLIPTEKKEDGKDAE